MISRIAQAELINLSQQYKAIAVIGPRQSGKTTLVKLVFPDKPYVNLENPDIRNFASEDPRAFLDQFSKGAILDEVQRTPELFSYLQQVLDENDQTAQFILTGSNNFLLQQSITQSLAGRVGYLNLLPFSLSEIKNLAPAKIHELLFKGFYPPLYDKPFEIQKWLSNYISTYIERDVRQLRSIENLVVFEKFLKLCAGRVGQLLNKNTLAIETGVDSKTIESWIGVLEASFIIFRLQPHHKNFNKRVVKMPKLYFYDVGLASALLGVQKAKQLEFHPFKGSLFENMVVVELLKQRLNKGKLNNLYFWRNSKGNEIDIIIDNFDELIPIEIKSGKTITKDYFKGLDYWNNLTGLTGGRVIYGGSQYQKRSHGVEVIPFASLAEINNR
ncbi:ATP-binding protein, P-loop_NTPAse superfamily [Psychroflexus torquis ATCC 700755]|uniref:ATP-binding protein, P-loop_NTPAse superfamily n=1 Tax=Psychroflexus torquis (strain ATCC 700755 / CIP 106069 / ACAM 623) TaxID=313595 RepID=K4IEN5_PSYTT|nr:ATP-binding protein [Psychroflexus torquis]AFU68884.1 ATP-binding protein, P-loop_NTPAse superfamily [Psychroflexus torquis ATCC 700755]